MSSPGLGGGTSTGIGKTKTVAIISAVAFFIVVAFFLTWPSINGSTIKSALSPFPQPTPLVSTSNDTYHIFFKSGEFTPSPGLDITSIKDGHNSTDTVHFLLQFKRVPSSSEKSDLETNGIKLLYYVSGNAYIASSKVSSLDALQNTKNIRWVGPLLVGYKISTILKTKQLHQLPSWAILNGSHAIITIDFHKDTDMKENIYAVSNLGLITANNTIIPSITILVDFQKINDIAKIDSVQFVDVVEPPLVTVNDRAREIANVNVLNHNPSYHLKGDGTTVMVYDGGPIAPHVDFGSRIISYEDPLSTQWSPHSTHVAGTVGGDGSNSVNNGGSPNQWAGMAPHARMLSYWFNPSIPPLPFTIPMYNDLGDMISDFNRAITEHHPDLVTMSLGTYASRLDRPDLFGVYSDSAIFVDNIVVGMPFDPPHPLLFIEAAGNNRNQDHPLWQFGTIDPPSTAKNSIGVGAINSNDYSITAFSSFGPTQDGRLKPDLVAPGSGPDEITSTGTNNDYTQKQGTSQATPVVSGAAALLVQQWRSYHMGSVPPPHTVKAILIHTATDLGNPGPDFKFGWGAVDAKHAVDLVKDNHVNSLIHRDNVVLGQTKSFTFASNGSDEVKATLVWDDPPGGPILIGGIQNDLDLQLFRPGSDIAIDPLVLDPSHPSSLAVQGIDNKNNVEMAIGNAASGVWTATVTGKSFTNISQDFTLVISNSYKRSTHTELIADVQATTGKVWATVSDTDSGVPILPRGNVEFDDRHGGIFTNQICGHEGSNLLCAATYVPSFWGTFQIDAKYSGDQNHNASSDIIFMKKIGFGLLFLVIIILIMILIILTIILYRLFLG